MCNLQISIMGILRSQDVRSTKAIYEIEDHTGTISAVLWIEGDSVSKVSAGKNFS